MATNGDTILENSNNTELPVLSGFSDQKDQKKNDLPGLSGFSTSASQPPQDEDSFGTNFLEGLESGGRQLWAGAKYALADIGEKFTDDDVWAYEIKNWAKDYVAAGPAPDDSVGQFLGSLVPSALPSALAIGSVYVSGGATLPTVASWAAAGGLGLASAGQGMMDYDAYKESIGEYSDPASRAAVGVAYFASELILEKLALNKLMPANVGQYIIRGNVDVAEKAGKQMIAKFAKDTKTSVPQLLKKIGMGSSVEGAQEALTELAQNITDNTYRDMEDQYDFGTILNNMKHAAIGGAIMGSGLGVMSYNAQNMVHNRRRKEQGFVRLGELNGEGVEILGMNKDQTKLSVMYPDGNVSEVDPDNVKEPVNITNEQFQNLLKGKTDETNALENSRIEMQRKTRDEFQQNFNQAFSPHVAQTEQGEILTLGRIKDVPVVVSKEADQETSRGGVYVAEVVMDENGMPVNSGNLKLVAAKDIEGATTMPVQEWQNSMLGPKLSNIADPSLPAPEIGESIQHPLGNGQVIAYDPQTGDATLEIKKKVGQKESDVEIIHEGPIDRAELDQYRTFNRKAPEKATQDAQKFSESFDEGGNPVAVEEQTIAQEEVLEPITLEMETQEEPITANQVSKGVYEIAGKKAKEATKMASEIQEEYPNLSIKVVDKTNANDPLAKSNFVVQIKTKKDDKKPTDSGVSATKEGDTDKGKDQGTKGKEEVSGQKGDTGVVSSPDIQKQSGSEAVPSGESKPKTPSKPEGRKAGDEATGKKDVESGSEQSVSSRAEKKVTLKNGTQRDIRSDKGSSGKKPTSTIYQVSNKERGDAIVGRTSSVRDKKDSKLSKSTQETTELNEPVQKSDENKNKKTVNNSGDDKPSTTDKSTTDRVANSDSKEQSTAFQKVISDSKNQEPRLKGTDETNAVSEIVNPFIPKNKPTIEKEVAKFKKKFPKSPDIKVFEGYLDAQMWLMQEFPNVEFGDVYSRNAFIGPDSTVYLISSAQRFSNPAMIEQTLLHEIVGHYGVRKALDYVGDKGSNKKFNDFMGSVFEKYKADSRMRDVYESYKNDPQIAGQSFDKLSKDQQIFVAEEYVAQLAETNKSSDKTLIDEIIDWFKEVLGIKTDMDNDMIRDILANGRRMVSVGDNMISRESVNPSLRFQKQLFHGTQYDFDTFMLSKKDGTGRKHFGYGLYFTDKEKIAKHYAKETGGRNIYQVTLHKGKTPDQYSYMNWDEALTKDQLKKIASLFGPIELYEDFTGEQIYREISRSLGGDRQASSALLDVGIDGIYFQTFKGGIGTNYVVFDEGQISIDQKVRFQKQPETRDNFYSNSLWAIRNVSQGKATGDQWKSMLLKNGASQSELDWIGFDDWLKDNPKPSKEEVYEFINSNKIEVVDVELDSYSDWQIIGGSNYKTILLTMPTSEFMTIKQEDGKWISYRRGLKVGEYKTESKAKDAARSFNIDVTDGIYESSHWDDPNVLSSLRINDFNIDGKNILMINEVQSDWSQDLRKGKEVPKTPFPNTSSWVDLSLKRALKYAVDNGYDVVAIPSGQEIVDMINMNPPMGVSKENETGLISFYDDIVIQRAKKLFKKLDKNALLETIKANENQQYSFPITPLIRQKAINQGMPMFQKEAPLQYTREGFKGWMDKQVFHWQDRYRYLKLLQDNKRKSGREITDDMNAYDKENLSSGKINEEQEKFRESYVTPLDKTLKSIKTKNDISYDEVGRYLQAKHISVDKVFSLKDRGVVGISVKKTDRGISGYLKMIDGTKKEFSSLTNKELKAEIGSHYFQVINHKLSKLEKRQQPAKARVGDFKQSILDMGGGGMTMQEAEKIVNEFEKKASKENLGKLTHDIGKIRDHILDKKLEYDAISKGRYDELKAQHEFFVPLRGFADMQDKDKTMRTRNYRRKGRESEAANPIPHMMVEMQTVIIEGEQNKVKKALLEFVKMNPDSRHYSIRNAWYLTNKETGDVTAKYTTPTPEEFKMYSVSRSEPLPETMTKEQYKDFQRSIIYEKDALGMMVDGKKVFIEFTDGNISKVFKKQGIDKMPKALNWMNGAISYLRKAYTQYSPEFGPRNFIRDISTGLINVRNDFGTRTSFDVMKNIDFKTTWKGIIKRDFSGAKGKLLREFIEQGGLTGYSDLKDVSEVHKEWERQIEGIGKEIKSLTDVKNAIKQTQGFKYTLGALDNFNRMLENTTRFAVYRTLREKGHSPQKAAIYAKDVTVNFNRKGANANWIGSMFLFWNASIQGIERLARPLVGEDTTIRKRAITTALTLPALHITLMMINEIMGGDDDDGESYYSKLSDYDRTHNLILPNPFASDKADAAARFFRVPLPYGYNVFFAWPDNIVQWMNGKQTAGDAVMNSAAIFMESFSPLGAPQFDSDLSVEGKALQYFSPTMFKIPIEVAFNTNFMGLPIYKEQGPYDTPRPNSEMYFNSVDPLFKEIAQTLNKATGGDKEQSGWIDVNPEVMEHYVSSYSGGLGKFLVNSTATMMNIARDGKETFTTDQIRHVPFVRNYITSPSSYLNRVDFFDKAREIEAKQDILNRYKKAGDKERVMEYRQENLPYLRMGNLAKNYRKKIKKLEDLKLRYETAGDEELVKDVERRQQELFKKFNKEYKQSVGGGTNSFTSLLGLD